MIANYFVLLRRIKVGGDFSGTAAIYTPPNGYYLMMKRMKKRMQHSISEPFAKVVLANDLCATPPRLLLDYKVITVLPFAP